MNKAARKRGDITAKYLEALISIDGWVTVSEWATRFGEMYPDLLEKANEEARNQANDTTGLREIAARISSNIARGAYIDNIEIDTSERPRKVRYVSTEVHKQNVDNEIEEDVAPLRRSDIIRHAEVSMGSLEKYRAAEFDAIARQLKSFFGLDFEVDHAKALLNDKDPGTHHPDNFHLILKAHNCRKNNDNWERFTFDDQVAYIESVIKTQEIVASRFGIEMESKVLGSLIERLKKVY